MEENNNSNNEQNSVEEKKYNNYEGSTSAGKKAITISLSTLILIIVVIALVGVVVYMAGANARQQDKIDRMTAEMFRQNNGRVAIEDKERHSSSIVDYDEYDDDDEYDEEDDDYYYDDEEDDDYDYSYSNMLEEEGYTPLDDYIDVENEKEYKTDMTGLTNDKVKQLVLDAIELDGNAFDQPDLFFAKLNLMDAETYKKIVEEYEDGEEYFANTNINYEVFLNKLRENFTDDFIYAEISDNFVVNSEGNIAFTPYDDGNHNVEFLGISLVTEEDEENYYEGETTYEVRVKETVGPREVIDNYYATIVNDNGKFLLDYIY